MLETGNNEFVIITIQGCGTLLDGLTGRHFLLLLKVAWDFFSWKDCRYKRKIMLSNLAFWWHVH